MVLENNELILSKEELINMIKDDNPDNRDWSRDVLVKMINSYKYLSNKQYEWVLSKIKYIVNHNTKYKNFKKKVKRFEFEENIVCL